MWTIEKIEKLKELFPNNFNKDISLEINETLYSINVKKNQLKLEKSKDFKTMISKLGNKKRIDNGGRNLTYNKLKEIASKYKTRIDFISGDGSAYKSALSKGFLDDICSHMTVVRFSIPQLILREILDSILDCKSSYNNRKAIKPYEIDVYYGEFKLGFEFQGIAWHKNNKNDIIKSNLAIDKGIKIIYINEYNGSRDYENDIKKQLINNLLEINILTDKKISKDDILNCKIKNIYLELYNKDDLIDIAKTYDCFIKFKKEKRSIYRKLLKMNLIDEATSHMDNKIIRKHQFTDEFLITLINNYDNLTDFRKYELIVYKHIKRLKKNELLRNLKRKVTYSIEDVKNKIKEYNNKTEFIKNNTKMYKFMRVNKLIYLFNQ